jgi:DNA-directed RNA polymerase specialized sigma24 family protein
VLWLHDAEGLTHEEIAAAFGRSNSFSKSQLARAHAQLRQWLEPSEEAACPVLNPAAAPSR